MPPESQNTQTTTPRRTESGNGPIFGALIIILVLVFGAFYFWDEHLKYQARNAPPPYIPSDETPITPEEDVLTPTTGATSTSAE